MHFAAFNTGEDFHLLDHIAPLAHFLDIPLFVTEELNFRLAKTFYPQVKTHYIPDLEFQWPKLLNEFDAFFECKYWKASLQWMCRELYQKKAIFIFCPHGQSEKGAQFPSLHPYQEQDIVLLYGQFMYDYLKALKIPLQNSIFVGNYRFRFYEKFGSFYDSIIHQKFSFFPHQVKLLYAPTWDDPDHATSFFTMGPKLFAELPQDYHLLIKPHPLLKLREPIRYYRFIENLKNQPNTTLIEEFPLIYPLLNQVDLYLGDASSVGYDFLIFEKPMYFFPSKSPQKIHACGKLIDPQKNIFRQLEKQNPLQKQQRTLYRYIFSPHSTLTAGKIKSVCKSLRLQAAGRTSIS